MHVVRPTLSVTPLSVGDWQNFSKSSRVTTHTQHPSNSNRLYFRYLTRVLSSLLSWYAMTTNTINISRKIRQAVQSVDPEAETILYGSRARGDEKSDSDWDILVLTRYPVDLATEQQFRDKIYDLELETGEPLSIFVYSKEDWHKNKRITPFYHNVVEEGVHL